MIDELSQFDKGRINAGHCPDCDHRGFVFGPRGGAAQNVECGNLKCRARFNITMMPMSRGIAFAQRIPKESDGGQTW